MNSAVLTLILWASFAALSARAGDPGDALFDDPPMHGVRNSRESLPALRTPRRIEITLDQAAVARLRNNPRDPVKAGVVVDGFRFAAVGMSLKGTGSFRPIDDKPSITLAFDAYTSSNRLDGLSRIHLNNSIEDGS
jgi:hypothetical protein